jgi:formylglycine-generating enzyme required for sulfatase activity
VARIFVCHSSTNNAEAIAIRDWMVKQGWDDLFLDIDPERGVVSGERWEAALRKAAWRCESVIFVISRDWLNSQWCREEFNLARHLNKRLFALLIEDLPISDLPETLTREWQITNLIVGERRTVIQAEVPPGPKRVTISFAEDGLERLKIGLLNAGLDPKYFAWPPEHDANRPPYRGLMPLEAEDAGIFFGREGPIVEALDRLRGLRDAPPPRLLVILGASGAGKSSFMRAGLLPRLARESHRFLPLPVVRPERAVLTGDAGLISSLEKALQGAGLTRTRADIRKAIEAGVGSVASLLEDLVTSDTAARSDEGKEPRKSPTLVCSIDQAEELFDAEGADEDRTFLDLLGKLAAEDKPPLIVLFTIRSDSYERLQTAESLQGLRQHMLSLPPMPKGAYAEVIRGPARRLEGTQRTLKIEEALVDALLADVEEGGGKDALPLLAFTLERLYREHGGGGDLRLSDYEELGRIRGSIEAAVERALKAADTDPKIPRDRTLRLALLRRSLIPWLAGIDPDTGSPRRRVALRSEIPDESRPLIDLLVEQRLLSTDVSKDTREITVEPEHEALLRQWGLLQGWLAEDAGLLSVLEGVKRASRDWAANDKSTPWLTRGGERLRTAEHLAERPDLAANLVPMDGDYLLACRKAEKAAAGRKRRVQALFGVLALAILVGIIGWMNQAYLQARWRWFSTIRPYMMAEFRPYVLTAEAEKALKPKDMFRECAKGCPEMMLVPAGRYTMGSPEGQGTEDERPQHDVIIAKPFAASKFEVTFDEWDACVAYGDCNPEVSDSGWGRGRQPVINVSWNDAQRYVAWLSRMTGKPYRLLSEAEWEYAARAGAPTIYSWGDEIGKGNANCKGCGSRWDGYKPAPVGSFAANAFGLLDMHGNVFEWIEDCFHENYSTAPKNGSAWTVGADCNARIIRGGSWWTDLSALRSAYRYRNTSATGWDSLGFRAGRTLAP